MTTFSDIWSILSAIKMHNVNVYFMTQHIGWRDFRLLLYRHIHTHTGLYWFHGVFNQTNPKLQLKQLIFIPTVNIIIDANKQTKNTYTKITLITAPILGRTIVFASPYRYFLWITRTFTTCSLQMISYLNFVFPYILHTYILVQCSLTIDIQRSTKKR